MSHNPNTVHLVVELGPESQAKLDKILEALQGQTGGTVINLATAQKTATPTEVVEEPTPLDVEEDEEPAYTKADIQELAQRLIAPDSPKKAQTRAIIKKYAPKISAIPAEQYAAVMRELQELDAK